MDSQAVADFLKTLVTFATQVLAPLGGVSVVVLGLSGWIGNIWAQRIIARERAGHSVTLEILKHQLLISRDMLERYRSSQFEEYNALWSSLSDLKLAADALWGTASKPNLRNFVSQLKETNAEMSRKALLIEDDLYDQLRTLLVEFARYSYGKTQLINLREQSASPEDIARIIDENSERLLAYNALLPNIRKSMRQQLHLQHSLKNAA